MPIAILKGKSSSSGIIVNLETFTIAIQQNPLVTSFRADTFTIEINQEALSIIASALWNQHVKRSVTAPIILIEIDLDDKRLKLASQDTELPSGEFFEGRVMQFGTISRSVSNTDGDFQISDVTLILANTDSKFSLLPFSDWLNREVAYFMGFKGYDRSAFMRLFKGVISHFKFNNTLFEITITDSTRLWLEKDYGKTIDPIDWPFAASGVTGTKMPIIYGEMTGYF